ncbi:hypothetical protein CEXT_758651 [Caerostris extrusa]|uniref:Uncharacterized protein n=1 Tax=Caerostris extrusa TaxID=172846 RepID=A0AAV4X597_CAEEX|nr:hypothetical protein CEXT_758651 [Caerostris extrusa]
MYRFYFIHFSLILSKLTDILGYASSVEIIDPDLQKDKPHCLVLLGTTIPTTFVICESYLDSLLSSDLGGHIIVIAAASVTPGSGGGTCTAFTRERGKVRRSLDAYKDLRAPKICYLISPFVSSAHYNNKTPTDAWGGMHDLECLTSGDNTAEHWEILCFR